jgi:hypothetical protein
LKILVTSGRSYAHLTLSDLEMLGNAPPDGVDFFIHSCRNDAIILREWRQAQKTRGHGAAGQPKDYETNFGTLPILPSKFAPSTKRCQRKVNEKID